MVHSTAQATGVISALDTAEDLAAMVAQGHSYGWDLGANLELLCFSQF